MFKYLSTTCEEGVLVATLRVHDRATNIFAPGLAEDLVALARHADEREDVRGVVLTSGVPGVFCAGADIAEFAAAFDREGGPDASADRVASDAAAMRVLEQCSKPVAAAINGLALGGGFELCLACHHRVMADAANVAVGLPEVTLGLLPAGGGTQRLPRLIGIPAALDLMLSGRSVLPAEALKLGLVDELAPMGELLARARRWVLAAPGFAQPWDGRGFAVPGGAGALAPHANASFSTGLARVRKETRDNYPAQVALLSAVYEGTQLPFDRGLAIEAKYFRLLVNGPVARNLVHSFRARKDAQKLVRRPGGIERATLRRIGILGGGMMGSGIAQVVAAAGIDVALLEISQPVAEAAVQRIRKSYERERTAGRIDAAEVEARLARITPVLDPTELGRCDFVIEAVFEQRDVKREIIERVARSVDPDSTLVFASNTSTLPIEGLAHSWPRPDRFIGLHFFSPVDRMPLVEVIVGPRTSEHTLAHALDLVARLRKIPLVVNDSPGFFTSRIFCSYIDEGMAMLAEGVHPALIENAARWAGFPTGPLAVTDEVSIELQHLVIGQAIADGLPANFLRTHAQPVVRKMMAHKRTGRKGGGGFYAYAEDGGKALWEGLSEHFPVAPQQPGIEQVKNRLLYASAVESVRCLDEGVVAVGSDADFGSVLGVGYPAWTGGAISLIDTVGRSHFIAECEKLADAHGERFRPPSWLRTAASPLRQAGRKR